MWRLARKGEMTTLWSEKLEGERLFRRPRHRRFEADLKITGSECVNGINVALDLKQRGGGVFLARTELKIRVPQNALESLDKMSDY